MLWGGDGDGKEKTKKEQRNLSRLHVPDFGLAIAAASHHVLAAGVAVQRVNVHLVPRERVADLLGLDVPHLDCDAQEKSKNDKA